jgi:EAL domain-containing protein (putative c-di-GMP-specific phosphodiesterase class I)
VETEAQHALLERLGCDEAQGYLYGRPVPPESLWAAIRALAGP